jgi:hypothetical protein
MKHIKAFEDISKKRQKLIDELSLKQRELDELENQKRTGIIPLEEYSEEEKIEYFNKMYNSAIKIVEELEDSGHNDDDDEHWSYEAHMEILNLHKPKEFWNYFNKISD